MTILIEKRHYDAYVVYESQLLLGPLAKIKCHCQTIAPLYFFQDLMRFSIRRLSPLPVHKGVLDHIYISSLF